MTPHDPVSGRTPLSNLGVLSSRQIEVLRALRISSAEALLDRIDHEYGPAVFGPHLELSAAQFDQVHRAAVGSTAHFAAARAMPRPPVAGGALKPTRPGSKELARLTPTVTPVPDLVARGLPEEEFVPAEVWQQWLLRMTPVRNQGLRGTCVAHAVCALLSYYEVTSASAEPLTTDFSEQFLYWWCKQHDGYPNESGTFVSVAVEGLAAAGVCLETTWPYRPAPVQGDESQGPPPPEALPEAEQHRFSGAQPINPPTDVEAIIAALDDGRVVAISVQTYPFWTNAYAWQTGEISMPLGEDPDRGHAICIVGYHRPSEQFLFKNSWSDLWGHASVARAGYGLLPFPYVEQDAWEAYGLA